jgi:hypothetical protein
VQLVRVLVKTSVRRNSLAALGLPDAAISLVENNCNGGRGKVQSDQHLMSRAEIARGPRGSAIINKIHVFITWVSSLQFGLLGVAIMNVLNDFHPVLMRPIRRGKIIRDPLMPDDKGGRSHEDGDRREARMDLEHWLTSDRYG